MNTFRILAIVAVSLCLLSGCGPENRNHRAQEIRPARVSVRPPPSASPPLKESFNEDDTIGNTFVAASLEPIRANFRRINSISRWDRIVSRDLWETTEGGEAVYYYSGGALQKIITRHYGEMGQLLTEYYLRNGKPSFIYEKSFSYNRPFYQDSAAMKEAGDTQAFDFDQSRITEDKSYFENGRLIHQINNEDCGAPFSAGYLKEEEERLTLSFSKLMQQITGK